MAIEHAGSIKFKTLMDTIGVTEGIKNIKKALQGMSSAFIGSSKTSATGVDKITRTLERAKIKVSETDKMLSEMYAKRDMMAESAINAAAPTEKARARLSDDDVDKILKNNKAIQDMDRQISSLERKLTGYKLKVNEASAENSKFGNTLNAAREGARQLALNLKGAGKSGNGTAKSIGKIREASGKAAKSVFNLTNMLKLMAIRMAMRAVLNAIGAGFKDLAVSNGRFNKTMSELSTSMLTARNAIASAFAPALQALTPLITSMIQSFVNALNVIGSFSAAMFGNARSFIKAKQAQVDYAKSVNNSTKAQKGQALAIDELNSIADESGSTNGMPEPQEMFEEVQIPQETISLAEQLKSLFESMWLPLQAINLDPLIGAMQRLFAAAAPLGQALFAGLQWAYHNVFVPLATWVIEDALPVFLDLISAALGVLSSVIESLKPLALWLWDNFLEPLAKWTGQAIIDAITWLTELFVDLNTWIKENEESFKLLFENIRPYLESFVQWFFQRLEAIKAVFHAIMEDVKKIFFGLLDFILGVFTGDWKKAWEGLKNIVSGVLGIIKIVFTAIWNDIKKVTSKVVGEIGDIFKFVVNGMIGSFEGFVNGAIRGINAIINALNKINFTIPSWVPLIGGKSWGFNLSTMSEIKIPRLATGAVIPPNNPFLAMLGDQKRGTNIEAPLETIVQAVKQALAEDGGTGRETVVEIPVILDGEVVYRNQKKISKSKGYDLGFNG